MEEYGGVYRIPCTVNGAKMKFIFDTGASNVCISMTMAEYLLDNGFIDENDILGTGSAKVADGRIVDHVSINLRDITIQNLHLYDVKALVVDGQNAPLLMGQSAIQKMGPIEISGNVLTIKNGDYNQHDIDKMFDEVNELWDNEEYSKARIIYQQLYQMSQLSDYGIYMYAKTCSLDNDDQKAFELLKEIKDYSYFEENNINIYRTIALISIRLKKYKVADENIELSINRMKYDQDEIFKTLRWAGEDYFFEKQYLKAGDLFARAINFYAKCKNVDFDYIMRDCNNELKKGEKSYRNNDIDYCMYFIVECVYGEARISFEYYLERLDRLAKAHNAEARKMLNRIHYYDYR